jgi:superfamily II DNA or RNA helicase
MDLDALMNSTGVEPRPYQRRIVARALDLFTRQGLRSVLIDSPTGSGKTIIALLVARALQEQLGLRVGWVAMRRYLLEQVRQENEGRGIGVQTCYLSMFDRDPPTGLDLLVVDEAQHDAATSMAHLHQVIRPRFILGLSATPFRADRIKLCFDSVIKDAGIQMLIQDGYLSPYDHYTIPAWTPAGVSEFFLRERSRWGRSLIYFHTLEQCEAARRILAEASVRAEVVTGTSDRESQLADFRSGAVEVLINCLMLSEGFNCPELQTVFCRPSCKGVTIQMAGRVLRQHPDLPVKQIVQCPRTRWPFPRTASARVQYTWTSGEWRSLTVNPLINQVQARTVRAIAQTSATLPQYLARQQNRLRARGRWARSRDE